MSNLVNDSSSKAKQIRVSEDIWSAVSHEAIDRRSQIGEVIAVAWQHFSGLPESRREQLVRKFSEKAA